MGNKQTLVALHELLADAAAVGAEETPQAGALRARIEAAEAWTARASEFFGDAEAAPAGPKPEPLPAGPAPEVAPAAAAEPGPAGHAAGSAAAAAAGPAEAAAAEVPGGALAAAAAQSGAAAAEQGGPAAAGPPGSAGAEASPRAAPLKQLGELAVRSSCWEPMYAVREESCLSVLTRALQQHEL